VLVFQLIYKDSKLKHAFKVAIYVMQNMGFKQLKPGADSGVRLGRSPSLKPTKVTQLNITFYNSENNIPQIRPFFRLLFCHI